MKRGAIISYLAATIGAAGTIFYASPAYTQGRLITGGTTDLEERRRNPKDYDGRFYDLGRLTPEQREQVTKYGIGKVGEVIPFFEEGLRITDWLNNNWGRNCQGGSASCTTLDTENYKNR